MITYKSRSDYVMRNIVGDNVLIKVQNSDYGNTNVFVFNDSGAFLWENLAEKKTRTQLVTLLVDKYDIEKTKAETDVDLFLEKCITEGVVSKEKEGT